MISKTLGGVDAKGDVNYLLIDEDRYIMHKFADGMSHRLILAMAAMNGDWAAARCDFGNDGTLYELRARHYFRMADAMLKVENEK